MKTICKINIYRPKNNYINVHSPASAREDEHAVERDKLPPAANQRAAKPERGQSEPPDAELASAAAPEERQFADGGQNFPAAV